MASDSKGPSYARDLGFLFQSGVIGGLSDRELLEHFVLKSGDCAQRAFEAIVKRHSSMVLGVCQRILRDSQLAEDVFQATFLVLALKAGSIRKPDTTIAVTSGFGNDELIVRELRTGKVRRMIQVPKTSGSYLAFATDGRVFASASLTHNNPKGDDLAVHLWDSSDGRELLRLDPEGRRVRSLAFSPDGQSLVTGMEDTTTLIWDVSAAYKAVDAAKNK